MILKRILFLVDIKLHNREVDGLAEAGHVVDRAHLVGEGENNLDDLIFRVEAVESGVSRVVKEERQLDRLLLFHI